MNLVNIKIDDLNWKQINDFDDWKDSLLNILSTTIKEIYNGQKFFSINLLLTNDDVMQKLNKNFRNKDATTNVLSFPQYISYDVGKMDTLAKDSIIEMGDISMSYVIIMRESKKFRIKFFDRCTHLFVHGTLHLFGLNHKDTKTQEEMETIEVKILNSFKIENPYILKGDNLS
jgi:probable rRNA maturation factor